MALKTGEQVYNAACAACHGAGVAGAPKKGDGGAWGARIAQGYDTLVSHAIKGIRGMLAKGGNPDLNDVEVARAVVHMANASGAKFKEPAAPAAKEEPSAQAATGKVTAPAQDKSAPVESGPRDVVRLSKSESGDLKGKLTVLVANLAPRKMKFGVSEGMVLCASPNDDTSL